RVVNPKSRVSHDTAILSYDLDETETIFGQKLTARYHATDTWMRRDGDWQIVAGQVLRYYEDPAAGPVDTKRYRDYAGTYELTPGTTATVLAEGQKLFWQRQGRPKDELEPEVSDLFFRKGVEGR